MTSRQAGIRMVYLATLGFASSPGQNVKGSISVQNNFTTSKTVKFLWCYGILEGNTFTIYSPYQIFAKTLAAQSSSMQFTTTFATPNNPGTWDLLGIVADDIRVSGTDIIVTGQYDLMTVLDGWIISGAAGIDITNVAVGY